MHLSRDSNIQGAMQDYNAALKLDPKLASGYLFRAASLEFQGDLERALADYRMAVELIRPRRMPPTAPSGSNCSSRARGDRPAWPVKDRYRCGEPQRHAQGERGAVAAGEITHEAEQAGPDDAGELAERTGEGSGGLVEGRSAVLPSVATAHEEGLANFDAGTWYGLFLPKERPTPIVRTLHGATIKAMNSRVVEDQLREVGATLVSGERRSPEYFINFVREETAK